MKVLNEYKESRWLYYYFVLCIFLSAAPFYFWNIPTHYFSFFSFFLFPLWSKRTLTKFHLPILLFFVFYIYAFFHQYQGLNIVGRFTHMIAPAFLFFIDGKHWGKIHKLFSKWYAIVIIPSLIVYFLVVFGGVNLPSHTIEPLNELKRFDYQAYPFYVLYNDPLSFYRFRGYFDEPGVIGTLAGVLFVCNHGNMKKWENWPILVSGIFSFSLFFFILVFLYLMLFGNNKIRFGLFILIFVTVTYLTFLEGSLLYDMIISRLEFEDGEWVGNNRVTGSFDAFYTRFKSSPQYWFGYGGGFSNSTIDEGGYSYKDLIVDYGIIFFCIYIISMFIYYLKNSDFSRKTLLCIIVFLSVIYQRPMVTTLLGIYLFLCCCYISEEDDNRVDKSIAQKGTAYFVK